MLRKIQGILLLILSLTALAMGPLAPGCRAERPAEKPAAGNDLARQLEERFIRVAKKVGPAAVSISTENIQEAPARRFRRFGPPGMEDELLEDFFRDFFGDMPQREFRQRGLGSGVIIDPDGYILTNEHVVHGADKVTVTLPDGREFKGEIRGTDFRSDLAVIQINAKNLPSVELGDSDSVHSGQWAIAIGNPFGWAVGGTESTLTVGVVSALHRSLRVGRSDRDYSDLIQTDAAINPGNSGGPLVNLDGQVIGINVAIFSTTGGYQGIGFAIPVNTAKAVLGNLIEGKKVQYGWLGVNIQDVTEELAAVFKLPSKEGAVIARVFPDTPAQKGGLKDGDVVVRYNQEPVKDVRELLKKVARTKVGEKATLRVIREGSERELTITIGERPTEAGAGGGLAEGTWRGLQVSRVTPELAERFGHPAAEGVIVTQVETGSSAEEAGLQLGDLILEINRRPISSVQDFSQAVSQVKGDALVKTTRGFFVVKESSS